MALRRVKRESMPYGVRQVEHEWIRMSDGVRLAARLWIPEVADEVPVPGILEFIPYRKRDIKRPRDQAIHMYFAGHGYACVRVDMRGSGDSEGILEDEYLPREQADGVEILRWMAERAWCDGNVGIIGLSWGGFNGLQIAAERPPELKAVISLCSTDDRYADDVHYMGGCLLGDNLSWASNMFAKNACPPDPAIVGDAWREMWLARLEANEPWILTWLRHQRRDVYWKHASVCEDISRIRVPVMAVSGWADGYSNAVFRLMEHLDVPRLGLIGAWSHKYPFEGTPGPAVGFLQECLRWWGRWLRGEETGIMDEPRLRMWMQDSMEPDTTPEFRRGKWVGEDDWPSGRQAPLEMLMSSGRLMRPEAGEVSSRERTVQSPLTIGLFAGKWCSYAQGPDMPYDQREEDGGALTWTCEPLTDALEILGQPEVALTLRADRPAGMVAVRLSEVAPDDKATRVTYGLLNLCHRESHEEPKPIEPGEVFTVRVPMNHVAHRFLPGYRVRVAVSTSYWPLAWTPPRPVRLTVLEGRSSLRLPVRPVHAEEDDRDFFRDKPPEAAFRPRIVRHAAPTMNWRVIRDLAKDESTLEVVNDQGRYTIERINLEVALSARERYTTRGNDFTSPRGETRWVHEFRRRGNPGWHVRTVTRTVLTCDADRFYVHAELDAYEGETRVLSRNWNESVERDLL